DLSPHAPGEAGAARAHAAPRRPAEVRVAHDHAVEVHADDRHGPERIAARAPRLEVGARRDVAHGGLRSSEDFVMIAWLGFASPSWASQRPGRGGFASRRSARVRSARSTDACMRFARTKAAPASRARDRRASTRVAAENVARGPRARRKIAPARFAPRKL